MLELARKPIRMVVLKNVIKTELIAVINVSKFVIQIKSVNNSHVKHKY